MKTIITQLIAIVFTIQSFGQCLESEQAYKDYFKKNITTLDKIEGIWSESVEARTVGGKISRPDLYRWAIIKNGANYIACQLSGPCVHLECNSKTTFLKTATRDLYLFNRTFPKSNTIAKANAELTAEGILELNYKLPTEEIIVQLKAKGLYNKNATIQDAFYYGKLIKLYPTADEYFESVVVIKKNPPSSGTGFAISNNGIIATNYHVIDGAESIKIRGINSDFHKSYNAKVLVSDKINDLALLQIDDLGFTSIATTPYIINTKLSTVGEDIFVLGYPLRASMGDEIKLTNGIISSKTGFQGEISSYQISAPVQPGNSGGPLFDSQGNLIGIVNAKHLAAENATYAVKSNYLKNLIDLLDKPPLLSNVNALSGKTLSQQVQLINQFVYIIEIN